MPEICRFFGIIIRMFFDDHGPPHIHAEYQGYKAVLDLKGNITRRQRQRGQAFDLGVTDILRESKGQKKGKESGLFFCV